MKRETEKKLYDIYELASLLSVSPSTIRKWHKKPNRIPYFRLKNVVRYDFSEVKSWLRGPKNEA